MSYTALWLLLPSPSGSAVLSPALQLLPTSVAVPPPHSVGSLMRMGPDLAPIPVMSLCSVVGRYMYKLCTCINDVVSG